MNFGNAGGVYFLLAKKRIFYYTILVGDRKLTENIYNEVNK